MKPTFYAVMIFVSCCLSLAGCGDTEKLHSKKQLIMGTTVEVISPSEDAAHIVFREMKRVENQLSYFDTHSEVAHLNKNGRVSAGEDLLFVLYKARRYWEISDGAFDITVAPLLDLWGFRGGTLATPDEEALKETMSLVGMDKVVIHSSGEVEFKVPDMKIDLGGIAKGYALDCAVERLREHGIESCLINCGGQVYALGKTSWRPWKAAIRDARSQSLRGMIPLTDESASTSGDYEQFFFEGNIRLSHIIDPRTGYPARSGIISVTVISPSALEADALSTAAFVLGPQKAGDLIGEFPEARIQDIQFEEQIK